MLNRAKLGSARSPTDVSLRQILKRFMACHPGIFLSAIVSACLLWVYAAQTGLGHWQTDEFRYFYDHHMLGWHAYFARFQVSPRPFSELLIYFYGSIVWELNQDLVPQALLTIWGLSLLAVLFAAWGTLHRSPFRLAATISLGIAPMIFVMQTNPITELFYWPAATFAYLPTIAGASSLLFLLGDRLTSRRRLWCGAALLISATSHEIGAALAIGFGIINGLFAIIDRRSGTQNVDTSGIADALWWIIPALAGFAVMLGLALFRSAFVDLGADTKPYTGRILASSGMACWHMLVDVISTGNSNHNLVGTLRAVVQKALFVSGFSLIWLQYGRVQPGRWHFALAIGLWLAAFFSIFAAYYHYGDLCCERQAATRHWLIDLLLILTAVVVLGRWSAMRVSPEHLGPLLLVASLLPALFQIPAIRSDARELAMATQGRARTWASGRALDSGNMRFYLPPDNSDMLIHGTSVPLGTFDLTKPLPDMLDPVGASLLEAVGRFFGKTVITTCQSWQTDQSFLINGVFIPACPPHGGPPDVIFNTVAP